jgi:hypothetical protein
VPSRIDEHCFPKYTSAMKKNRLHLTERIRERRIHLASHGSDGAAMKLVMFAVQLPRTISQKIRLHENPYEIGDFDASGKIALLRDRVQILLRNASFD